ncbi:MAG: GNAT family N-acetyltransferase [Myxococcota bacterium]|nr:GNAT family N-acetyltransferase [Myxococcota bacterium]
MSETLRELKEDIRVIRIESLEEATPFRASFVGAYQTVWTAPPYREVFYPYEAEGVLRRTLETPNNTALLAVRGQTQVVGFGFAVPMSSRPDVARQVQGLLPIPHSVYFAELGVLPRYRGLGLGRVLVQERLNAVDRQRYSHVVLRTSATKGPGYQIYSELGFHEIGVYMEVNSRRLDGNVTTDRRMLLSRVLEADAD